MSPILLPLHNGNTNWLQFASTGLFRSLTEERGPVLLRHHYERQIYQEVLAAAEICDSSMLLKLWLKSMGWRGCKCGQYIPQSQGLVHVMSSISEVKYMVFLPSHCIHQSQVFLCANVSWPFILKKSSSVSHLLNSSCALCTSFFSVCLNTPNFLLHPCLASQPLSPFIGFPFLPAQCGAKAGELLQKVYSKQTKFQTLPRESVPSIPPSFVQ